MKLASWFYFLIIFTPHFSTSHADNYAPVEAKYENAEIINSYYDFLTGLGLLKLCDFMRAVNIDYVLRGAGAFTLFGPTDDAFNLIPFDYLKVIQNNKVLGREFILGHMMNNFVSVHGIANEAVLPCISGAPVRFNVYHNGEVITISGAKIIQPAQRYGSMLVYFVDRVVYPISGIDLLNYTRDNFASFYDLLNLADIGLFQDKTYTIFAPVSQSFEGLPKVALDLLYSNRTLLKDVLLNHLVENTYFTAGLVEGTTLLKTLSGTTLTATPKRGLVLIDGVPIIKPDIHLSNGVLHGISRLILPRVFLEICRCFPLPANGREDSVASTYPRFTPPRRPTAVSQIVPRFGARIGPVPSGFLFISPPSNHSVAPVNVRKTVLQVIETPLLITGHRTATLTTAAELFKKAGLLDTLAKTSPLTTILPTDEAFSSLPNGTLDKLKSDTQVLKELLLCHLVARSALPTELQNNLRLPTYGGISVTVKIVRKVVLIGGCQVVAVSRVTNGIVYIVDRVIYPQPARNLLAALQAQPLVSRFLELALKAKMEALLTGPNYSTCFVPRDLAFSLFPSSMRQKLLTDPYFLKEFILQHCAPGIHFSKEFTNYLTLTSYLREALKFEIKPDGIYINGAKVIFPDISAGNGVLHIVDSNLKPLQTPPDAPEELTTLGCAIKETTAPASTPESQTTEAEKEPKAATTEMTTKGETETEVTTRIEAGTAETENTVQTTDNLPETTTGAETESTVQTTDNLPETTTGAETMTTERNTEITTESDTEMTTEATTAAPSLLEAIKGEGIDTFVRWLNDSGYLDSIQDGGEYTIFVPTDEAIDALPPTLRNVIEKQSRKKVKTLKHHIVPSSLDLDQIPDETTLPTLLPGKDIRINHYNDKTTASGAPTGKRIKVGNIQFVTIDRVLEPPTNDLHAAISKSSLLKKITKIIEVAGLEDELKNGGPYTFYAPSKKAFKKMPPEEINKLLTDPAAAKDFVLRHLVRGAKYTSGMDDGSVAITENGNLLEFTSPSGRMKVNTANMNFSDINATNGVLHIIDNVL